MRDTVSRFSGFAGEYDANRPAPPGEIVDLLVDYSGAPEPSVVDLGSGTGLSTAPWRERAGALVGVEPNPDMLAVARRRLPGCRFLEGTAEDTGLPADSADVITASQAMHWFTTGPALQEIGRVLRPGGVFAAFDCDWPPLVHPDVDEAYREFEHRQYALQHERDLLSQRADKREHLERMRASGQFTAVREIALHNRDSGDARQLLDLAGTQSGVVKLRKAGLSDREIGLEGLAEAAHEHMTTARPWWWTYRVRIGVR
jgi:SAM-dependent methyltransferase